MNNLSEVNRIHGGYVMPIYRFTCATILIFSCFKDIHSHEIWDINCVLYLFHRQYRPSVDVDWISMRHFLQRIDI